MKVCLLVGTTDYRTGWLLTQGPIEPPFQYGVRGSLKKTLTLGTLWDTTYLQGDRPFQQTLTGQASFTLLPAGPGEVEELIVGRYLLRPPAWLKHVTTVTIPRHVTQGLGDTVRTMVEDMTDFPPAQVMPRDEYAWQWLPRSVGVEFGQFGRAYDIHLTPEYL